MMLLRQLHCKLVYDISSIALESGVESSVTVYYDKAERRLADEELFLEVVEVEPRVAVVNGEVDWLEGLEVTDQLLLGGGVGVHDSPAEEDESVFGRSLVEFESFSGGHLGFNHALLVGLIFDLGGSSHLFVEELGALRYVFFGRHDDSHDASINFSRFQSVEELLHPKNLDRVVNLHLLKYLYYHSSTLIINISFIFSPSPQPTSFSSTDLLLPPRLTCYLLD